MSELFREALRRYLQQQAEWQALLAHGRARGRAVGITSEADIERLVDEYRRDGRRTDA